LHIKKYSSKEQIMSNLSQGSRGQEVVALQRALNAQLYPSPGLVDDGIFGQLTRQAVVKFQQQAGITVDGIVGPETRASLGLPNPGSSYTHRVGLHFRSLKLTNVPFNRILNTAKTIYAQYGIKLEYRSGESLNLTDAEARKFARIDGTCRWEITNGEYAELQRLGGATPNNEITVFYVDGFSEAINGCGGHLKNRPACFVADQGTRWTTAHEIGHVLLTGGFDNDPTTPGVNNAHSNDNANLMYRRSSLGFANVPILTAAQVRQIKSSPCCVAI